MLAARHHPRGYCQKQMHAVINGNAPDQLVTAAPSIALVSEIHLIRIDRVDMFVEEQLQRVLVLFIVGNEYIAGVAKEQAFRIEQFQRPQ